MVPNPRYNYVLRGVCYKSDGSTVMPNAHIIVINQNSGEALTTTCNSDGKYLFDCNNFITFSNGDVLEVFGYTKLISRHVISSLTTATTKEYRFTVDYEFEDDSIGEALVVNAGLNSIRDWMNGDSVTAPTHIEWNDATGLPASGDTQSDWDSGGSNEQRNAISAQSIVSTSELKYDATLTSAQLDGVSISKSS